MSLKTWKKEFYPVPASWCAKKNALQHSIMKWEGLSKKNLAKHGLDTDWFGGISDEEGEELDIDYSSCALCHWHFGPHGAEHCHGCPIMAATGDDCATEFKVWAVLKENRPMLALLRKVKKITEAS